MRWLHFIHERGQGPNPLPIILTHGFPDSFLRFAKLIPMLADPASHGGDPAAAAEDLDGMHDARAQAPHLRVVGDDQPRL